MDGSKLNDLQPGNRMTVSFGSRGSQCAEFVRYGICQGRKSIVVRKYRQTSRSWTKPVHVMPAEILALKAA